MSMYFLTLVFFPKPNHIDALPLFINIFKVVFSRVQSILTKISLDRGYSHFLYSSVCLR